MTSCRLCKRECSSSSSLCEYHLTAKLNLESAYRQWSEAYGGMTWREYLLKVTHNAQTGQWAKEVAQMLADESPKSAGTT